MAGGLNVVADEPPRRLRRPERRNLTRLRGPVLRAATKEKPAQYGAGTIMPPPDYESSWRNEQLDTDTLTRTDPTRLLELLANLSPEMSKGLWDYMRLLNPGWTVTAFRPGSETPNVRAQAVIDEFMDRLKRTHGSVDVVLGRLHMGAYLRGAYFAEIVFDEAGREALDLATPDPASVRFKVVEEDGQKRLQMGQWQGGKFVPLDDEPGVSYIPVDSFPGSPYGRPLVAPAMFAALFLIGLLHDLRRVISQQGWPRVDIVLNTEKILEGIEAGGKVTSEEGIEGALRAAVADVQNTYAALQPDDAWVHGDEVEVKGPIGVTSGANLAGIEGVIDVIERMEVRALKTMPLMLGITDGVSEANANRQWEILVAGVKAMQHLAESKLERFLELACQMKGIQADVRFAFAEIRAAEAQRDALTRSQEIDNEFKLLDRGIIDQDEAAQNLVGHPPAADDPLAGGGADDEPESDVQDPDENPEPSGGNAAPSWEPYVHRTRPAHIASRAAYRAFRLRDGGSYRTERRRADSAAPGLLAAFREAGADWVLVALRRDRTGEPVEGLYDVFTDPAPQW